MRGGGSDGEGASLDAALRAMEPVLPAPPESLIDPEQLAIDLQTAEICDGALPDFLNEQRASKTPEQLRREALTARYERGRRIDAALPPNRLPGEDEFADWALYIDPAQGLEPQPRKKPARGGGEGPTPGARGGSRG